MTAEPHLQDKVLDLATLVQRYGRPRPFRLVFTNGCFDLIHRGHVEYLHQAKALGDRLVVGLNSDGSVRRLKGQRRPVNPQQDRAVVLAALAAVDAVCIFDEDTPLRLIQHLLPDVLVKGGDYSRQTMIGADVVEAAGGRVVVAPLVPGRSTTALLQQIATDEER